MTEDCEIGYDESGNLKEVKESVPPLVLREENRLVLNSTAQGHFRKGDRIVVAYGRKEGRTIPVMGTAKDFKVGGGKLLTGKGTMSFRGLENSHLAGYGTLFRMVPEGDMFALVREEDMDEDMERSQENENEVKNDFFKFD